MDLSTDQENDNEFCDFLETIPKPTLFEIIAEKKKREEERAEGDILGLKLNNFKGIESDLSGIQNGLILLAGR